MEMKKCSHCGSVLPLTEFGKDKYQKDGHNVCCKECIRSMQKANRDKKKMVQIPIAVEAPTQIVSDGADITKFTSRELLKELKARGYKWTDMTITQRIDYAKI